MKQSRTGKHGYRSFCAPWKGIRESWQSSSGGGGLFILWGTDDYLLWRGARLVRAYWKLAESGPARTIEPGELKGQEAFGALWQERDLFSGRSLYLLTQAEKYRNLGKMLKDIPSGPMSNILVFLVKGRSLNATVQKEVKRLQATEIPCFTPRQGELGSFVNHLCKEFDLKLSGNAVRTLNEAVGGDLFKTENEIKKLATIFHGQQAEVDSDDIAPYLGLLREDHAFALSQMLCRGEKEKALDLALDLLGRGESAVALNSIISRHIRTALRIKAGGSSSVRLPFSVLREYETYCRSIPYDLLKSKLLASQEADMMLKGLGRVSGDLVLTSLLTGL